MIKCVAGKASLPAREYSSTATTTLCCVRAITATDDILPPGYHVRYSHTATKNNENPASVFDLRDICTDLTDVTDATVHASLFSY